MLDWRRAARVGLSTLALAATVALAIKVWFSPPIPLSVETARGDAPSEVARVPAAAPVAHRSPVIKATCGGPISDAQPSAGLATARHRNAAGNYEFLAPPSWELRNQDSISKLIGPRHDFEVSLGPGPVGGLPRAYDEFVELVNRTYGNVRLDKIDAGCAAGDLSVWLRGRATNAAAEPFDFLAVIIERSSGGTVGAFGAWKPNVAEVRPVIREVMESFRALPVRG